MDKKKVTVYFTDELNTKMWTFINETSKGTSTYGAMSNFVSNAVTSYLAEPYHTEYFKDDFTAKTEPK